ncbi:MAG: hypothetical protein AN486_18910 [Anabaena sp. AL93]|nr:MAG: hypothetical protein AN486_18910 [Anabaena sp. AL93]
MSNSGAIAPPQLPNSELTSQRLRYRTPSTSQIAIPRSRFAIALPQLPKQRFLGRAYAIALPQLPKQRFLGRAYAIAPLQLPKQR